LLTSQKSHNCTLIHSRTTVMVKHKTCKVFFNVVSNKA